MAKMTIQPIQAVNTREIAQKGEEVYQNELKKSLEKKYKGKYVAIDVDSHAYFMGDSIMEANQKAKKKFPEKVFYLVKIGYPAVFRMSHSFTPLSYGSVF